MKKAAALILIISLIFTVFCSCDGNDEPTVDPAVVSNLDSSKEGVLKLAYSKADMLDPFTATMNANIQILGLVYDGLFKLDKAYEPIPVLAKSGMVSDTSVNVNLDTSPLPILKSSEISAVQKKRRQTWLFSISFHLTLMPFRV